MEGNRIKVHIEYENGMPPDDIDVAQFVIFYVAPSNEPAPMTITLACSYDFYVSAIEAPETTDLLQHIKEKIKEQQNGEIVN